MTDSPIVKIAGFLNGLDCNSSKKNPEGHTEINQESISYLLEHKCNQQELIEALLLLEEKNKLKMIPGWHNYINMDDLTLGWLFGWIDPKSI